MFDRRIRRQFRLLLLLRSQELISAKALADRCQVNVRTVYRDIEDLLQTGLPIEGMPGPDGGYRLTPGVGVDPSIFDDEGSFRAFVLRSSHVRRVNDEDVEPAVETAVVQDDDWMQLALAGKLYIQIKDTMFREIRRGILHSEAVLIRRSLKGENRLRPQEEVVVPLGLVLQTNSLHLVARDLTGEIFSEPMGQIGSARTLGLSLSASEPFNVKAWWKDNIESAEHVQASVRTSSRARRR